MKIIYSSLIWLLLAVPQINAQTNIGGLITTNTTLTAAGSPYLVTNNILVLSGVVLTIEPGVTLNFGPLLLIQIDGELHAIGNSTSPILFTASSSWSGIKFGPTAVDYDRTNLTGSILDHCIIEKTFDPTGSTRALLVEECWPMISNCEIRNFNNDLAIELRLGGYFINNKVHDGQYVALEAQSTMSKWIIVEGNEFYDLIPDNNPAIDLQFADFKSNYVRNISAITCVRVEDTANVTDNTFKNNFCAALLINGGNAHNIQCNTFENNLINIAITCVRNPVIKNNNFISFQSYNIYWASQYLTSGNGYCVILPGSGNFSILNIDSNYWGGLNSTQINTSIWDNQDDVFNQLLIEDNSPLAAATNCSVASEIATNSPIPFSLLPNPSSGIFQIVMKDDSRSAADFILFDSTGRIIYNQQLRNPNTTIILPLETAGVYYYKIFEEGESQSYNGKIVFTP